jgi:hypothetical protein
LNYSRLDFLSRDCRNNDHNECSGLWRGLGLEVYCYCGCHSKEEASASVERPVANAIANIPLTPNETVNMKLMVIRNGPTKYTMQYHDVIRGVIIRSDNFHGYRHIDIELPQERLPPIPISELTECSSVVMGSPTFLLFLYSTSVQLVTLHNSQMVP